MISLHQKRLLYSQFYKWLEDSRALTGFNLTEKLVQEVYSDLDPHKKGYLTENDWLNAFGNKLKTYFVFIYQIHFRGIYLDKSNV